MRNPSAFLIALSSFAVGAFATASLTSTARAQDPRPAERWEYRAYQPTSEKTVYSELDKLGEQGWEAYAFGYAGGRANWELRRRR